MEDIVHNFLHIVCNTMHNYIPERLKSAFLGLPNLHFFHISVNCADTIASYYNTYKLGQLICIYLLSELDLLDIISSKY